MKPRRRIWLAASLPRALLEAAALVAPLFAALVATAGMLGGGILLPGMLLLCGLAALWLAARWRVPGGSKWVQAWRELVASFALAVALIALYAPLLFLAGGEGYLGAQPWGALGLALVLSSAAPLFLGLRVLLRLWLLWDRLRRRRLVFALAHSYLTVLLVVSLPFVLALAVYIGTSGFSRIAAAQPSLPVSLAITLLIGILPTFTLLMLFVVAGELLLLPPFALISYLAARRVTGRLLALAVAAGALRQGDYAARVPVDGDDEVARLGADFNAMADELSRAIGELRAERDRVSELLRARRELIANVSHELRTPIATVRAYLDSVLDGGPVADGERLRRDLAVMDAELMRLQGLVEDLFALSRVEVGAPALVREPVEAAALVEAAVAAMAPLAWQAGKVQVLADPVPPLPPVLADPRRLEQVLANLLRNAVRATPPGGLVVAAIRGEGSGVLIEVRDTGTGIAPDELSRVWERFYHSPGGDGAGIGLALVKELTEAMGGRAWAASTPGQGSTFTIRLPNAEIAEGNGETTESQRHREEG